MTKGSVGVVSDHVTQITERGDHGILETRQKAQNRVKKKFHAGCYLAREDLTRKPSKILQLDVLENIEQRHERCQTSGDTSYSGCTCRR